MFRRSERALVVVLLMVTAPLLGACGSDETPPPPAPAAANSALAVAFHPDDTPEILFIPDTEKFKGASRFVLAAVLLSRPLADITDTICGLDLPHEQAVERMTAVLLTNLSKLAYETRLTDPQIISFANALDNYALNGIVNGIAAAEKSAQPPSLQPCPAPNRN